MCFRVAATDYPDDLHIARNVFTKTRQVHDIDKHLPSPFLHAPTSLIAASFVTVVAIVQINTTFTILLKTSLGRCCVEASR